MLTFGGVKVADCGFFPVKLFKILIGLQLSTYSTGNFYTTCFVFILYLFYSGFTQNISGLLVL